MAFPKMTVENRSAHTATFHPTQLCYFVSFAMGMSAPFCLSRTRLVGCVTFCRRHWILAGTSALAVAFFVDSYTVAHPYLLADNRYTAPIHSG